MRQTIDKSQFILGRGAEKINTSMLDTHMAKQFAYKSEIGFSSILMEQLSKGYKQNENVKKELKVLSFMPILKLDKINPKLEYQKPKQYRNSNSK
ncbi:MAG: rod-binding protein [Desulfobacterales bacterium]|nr:rod-binding protein [Desulfobacterales bacterium]